MPPPTLFPIFKVESAFPRWQELISQLEGQHLSPGQGDPGAQICSWPFLEEPGRARCGAGPLCG